LRSAWGVSPKIHSFRMKMISQPGSNCQ
jgi:hypothetical protein